MASRVIFYDSLLSSILINAQILPLASVILYDIENITILLYRTRSVITARGISEDISTLDLGFSDED